MRKRSKLWLAWILAFIAFIDSFVVSAPLGADADIDNVAVVQTDPTILQPGEPFDLNGKTVIFTPKVSGGYAATVIDVSFDANQGSNLSLGDDDFVAQPLQFDFPFFGSNRDFVYINSNGNLTFDESDPTARHFNQVYGGGTVGSLGDGSTVFDDFAVSFERIAPLWQDLDPAGGGAVNRRSAADRLVVTWNNVPLFGTAIRVTFQVVLFSSGVIHFNYQSVRSTPGGGYLVGISPGNLSFGPFGVTAVDFSQGGQTLSADGEDEALAQIFGTSTAPMVHINSVARRFYASHGDHYDQLVMFANFNHAMGGAFAYELSPKNDVSGIGVDLYDSARLFGSSARLQSFVNMNRLNLYPSNPTSNISGLGTNNTLDILGQEAGHRWLAFVEYNNGVQASSDLLGRDKAHWSFFLDSDASVMEGNKWRQNSTSSFTTTEATARYSQLDQYLMGLRSAGNTQPFFVIDNAPNTVCAFYPASEQESCPPKIGVTVSGQRENVSINQIINVEGSRSPLSGFSTVNPTNRWKQAFILLVKSATAPSADLTKIANIRNAWVPYFADAVGGLGAIDSLLPGGEPKLQFSSAEFSVDEGGASATITVTRSGSTAEAISVDYATANGTATDGADYAAAAGTLNFATGQTSQAFTVAISEDAAFEGNETVNLTLSNPTGGAILGTPASALLTIVDNEPAFNFSQANYTVSEAKSSVVITVVRTGPTTAAASVNYATSNGSAAAPGDYATMSGTLAFTAGQSSRTFSIPIVRDTLDEDAETVNLTLSNPSPGSFLGAQSSAVLTIADNDTGGVVQFSAANYNSSESRAAATITVKRTGGAASNVTVKYATSNGTALDGMDYTGVSGILSFGAGQSSRTFIVPILNDALVDGARTVNLTLSEVTGGATLGALPTAVLTIADND